MELGVYLVQVGIALRVDPMTRLSLPAKSFLVLVAFSLAGSLLSKSFNLDPGLIRPIVSLLTIATGFYALARTVKLWQASAVVGVGAAAEICGLYTGFPFGDYAYTTVWQPVVALPQNHLFPVAVPFAWFLVAGGCALALRPLGKPMLVLAPLMATLIDFFMEPVMTRTLGYWRWLQPGPLPGGAPWLNMAGWFATSFVAALILQRGKTKNEESTWILAGYVALVAGLWVIG